MPSPMETMLKGMLGIDPEQLKKDFETFVSGVRAKMEAVDGRMENIEHNLVVMHDKLDALMHAMNVSPMQGADAPASQPLIGAAQFNDTVE